MTPSPRSGKNETVLSKGQIFYQMIKYLSFTAKDNCASAQSPAIMPQTKEPVPVTDYPDFGL
jgi:hypothetical protein